MKTETARDLLIKQKNLLHDENFSFRNWVEETAEVLLLVFPVSGASKAVNLKDIASVPDFFSEFPEYKQIRYQKRIAHIHLDHYIDEVETLGAEPQNYFRKP